MSLKQRIRERKLLESGAVDAELVLPGEPLIYSIKYAAGQRTHWSLQMCRNDKWKSLLKCFFKSYYSTKIPVVIDVCFYVSPPSSMKIKRADLIKETFPAVKCFELCDYFLSFLEILQHVLINSYQQVVKVEMKKFYSANPRTVFKFMKWDHYVGLQNRNTVHAESKRVGSDGEVRMVQSQLQGNEADKRTCKKPPRKALPVNETVEGSGPGDCALSNTSTSKCAWKKTASAKPPSAYQKTGRRQLGEISK